MKNRVCYQWRSQGARQTMAPTNPVITIRMVGNGGPITGCLIHKVITYSGIQDACVRFFPSRQKIFIIQIGLN